VSVEDDAEEGEQALRLILADAARAIRALRRKARSDDAQRARIATLGRIINYGSLALECLPENNPRARCATLLAALRTGHALDSGRYIDSDA
jgi:hypothetical protein